MPDPVQPTFDTSSLDPDYTIVGELGSSDHRRTLTAERKTEDAKRKDDHTGVLIAIYSTPEGDEANALSHLAADTKILASESHRRLVPVIEGRWLGDDQFAVVTQRLNDPTITQRLASREAFSTVRIAAILRELNGLLDWAREQGIVHRLITGDGVYLEPRTDRVRVTFDVAPLHRVRPGEETRDARTIARLAMALLAGVEDPESCTVEMLQELRPELPKRLAKATSELIEVKNNKTKTDIVNFIALIGMSDPLYQGEEEEKRIRAEILEEQRAEREKLANERKEFETKMASERSEFETMSAKERADVQAQMERERARLDAERLSLQKAAADERAKLQKAMAQERADLGTKKTEMEKAIAAQKAELERAASLDRKKLEELRVELKRRGEAEIERKRQVALENIDDAGGTDLDEEELSPPIFVGPNLVPLESLSFDDENEVLSNEPIVFEATSVPEKELPEPVGVKSGKHKEMSKRNRWLSAIGGGIAVLMLTAVAIVGYQRAEHSAVSTTKRVEAHAPARVPTAPSATLPPSAVPLPLPSQIVDSAGGSVAPSDSLRMRVASDSAAQRAAARAAARRAAQEKAESDAFDEAANARTETRTDSAERPIAPVAPVVTPTPSPTQSPPTTSRPMTRSVADTIFDFRKPRQDSAAPRDTAPVRRDSVTPRDTTKPPTTR